MKAHSTNTNTNTDTNTDLPFRTKTPQAEASGKCSSESESESVFTNPFRPKARLVYQTIESFTDRRKLLRPKPLESVPVKVKVKVF